MRLLLACNPRLHGNADVPAFYAEFCCNGTVVDDPELGQVRRDFGGLYGQPRK